MAPFIAIWALVWVILSFPGYPATTPLAMVKLIAAICFLVYCVIVILTGFGTLRIG